DNDHDRKTVFLFNLFLFCPSDGFMYYNMNRCVFNSTELKDMEYIYSSYYNKLEYVRFSSSLGKFIGYTEFGVKNAERWNNDPAELSRQRAQKETYCQPNIGMWYSKVLVNVLMLPQMAAGKKQEEDLTVKAAEEQTGVSALPGNTADCHTESVFVKELTQDHDPSMPKSDKVKIIIGASALILGLIFALAGFIYYSRRTPGLTLDQVLSLARFIYCKKEAQGQSSLHLLVQSTPG
uniref:MHC class II beta chain N-terminal domain-containing protein n=1 Tax=Stegastes partitus TaxID=144197 RepID=A0A3B5B357_9TELE